ncbi:iron chelate uptake ABC transporter family permease subunit [Clostridium swellfunianum]|uniref:iron chelate uptake ABC transporter family permease subunit n=1 Tax=Clostridium swellfunianum TaxID=1367462 RepID=UPI00202F580A|nr:iron chelate uptake ABC transporter family permease subunit [Clostridium swellfunianum]MCM0647146.1 iron chelate uptake ABC transporter family permease subunit [Clostridium swellfunianum]
MGHRKKIALISILSIVLIILFITLGLTSSNYQYALSRRIPKTLAIILTGGTIAFSSMIFQTITNNRILTPSVLGLDSLYMFIQTFVVFVLGSKNITTINSNVNFALSIGLMMFFSVLLFNVLFRKENSNIYFLLLVGLIFGTLFQSLSSFMQMIIDPNEFTIIQGKMFASFNSVNTGILWVSTVIIAIIAVYTYDYIKILDVLSLGREQAINLGVNYDKVVKRMLIVVAILVSISTALVGPITFLGLLVVNLSREFLKTYKHSYLIIGSILISIVALIGGQLVIERFMNFSTTLSVIINFIGGLYFIYLLLKENKA